MRATLGSFLVAFLSLSAASAGDDQNRSIPLTVPSGAPLRLYLTRKISKRAGVPVEAKLLEPVYSFDREVIPAGVVVRGRVSRIESITKWQRFRTILGGDFTPLHRAEVEFTELAMRDGHTVALDTTETVGLTSIYTPPRPPKKKKAQDRQQGQTANGGVLGTGRQTAKEKIDAAIHARTKGVAEIVRGPNKKERLIDFAVAKLPYHPQWVRRGTRFDAELKEPLSFGTEDVAANALDLVGSQPRADSQVHARLTTPLDSASAKKGQAVEAVIAEPLFSPEHKLVLPEGTRVLGTVVLAKKARRFHRGGQLRFNFQTFDLPEEASRLQTAEPERVPVKTQAILAAAEPGGKAAIKVDSEGGVKATESKTRLLAPLIAVMIANKSADVDAGRHGGNTGGGEANVGGRTMGGGSGLGLLGAAVSQSSKYVGTALGFYGMAWSVYSNVIARGGEVQFDKNAVIDIKFGARTPAAGSKFAEDVGAAGN